MKKNKSKSIGITLNREMGEYEFENIDFFEKTVMP